MNKKWLIPIGIGLCIMPVAILLIARPGAQHTNIAEEGMAGSVKTTESSNTNNTSGYIE